MEGLPTKCDECKFCEKSTFAGSVETRTCSLSGNALNNVNADLTPDKSTYSRAEFCPLEPIGEPSDRDDLSAYDIAKGDEAEEIDISEWEEGSLPEDEWFDDILVDDYDDANDWDDFDDPY